ncbi:MAG: histidine--tRNA ligase [Flavobacteriales bacterium]|nr:histidine--tRNA ligase [Flavobacteriales bacterium]
MSKPSIPKGTRDFSPEEMLRRNYIFDVIKKAFISHGFNQIETPSMENLSTLTGKYGEEGDRLIFKVLNRGDKFLKSLKNLNSEENSQGQMEHQLCAEGLRYDLTVPFARYVVQHQNEINFPFKRFQIQPVWRADRPQKGRYREFYQCDADIIGSNSLTNEISFIQLIDSVFKSFGIKGVAVKVNNRKILSGIAEITGQPEKIIDITVAIDKLDKIGVDLVLEELSNKGLTEESISIIKPLLDIKGDYILIISSLKNILKDSMIGLKGVEELEFVFNYFKSNPLDFVSVQLDMTLARGLNYYTGAIFEVIVDQAKVGSVSGGGRYDDLTGIFGLKDVSGIGISFGADRIYDVMLDQDVFPDFSDISTQLLVINNGEDVNELLRLSNLIRSKGVITELYPDNVKLKKQMKYANGNKIPYVLFVTEENSIYSYELKNMISGEQIILDVDSIIEKLNF